MYKRVMVVSGGLMTVLLALFLGLAQFGMSATAGPVEIGKGPESNLRAIVADGQDGDVRRIEYFTTGTKTMSGANTPVPSIQKCGLSGDLHRADVRLVGTMSGTAPTLAIKWQNSIDGGTTWTDVGTWTTINATVTPAAQSQVVSDIVGSTAVAYGDCWRATYTFGGSGTVTANFSVKGIEK